MAEAPTTALKRKIAVILAADVAGYTRLVALDEERTLRRLAEYRAVFDDFIARSGGRIFNTAGDSVMCEFTSAVDAVRCAIDLQEALRTRNTPLPAQERLEFRIGITIGDVVARGTDLLGDGVNIAARLESLAEPGGICVSQSVHDAIVNKVSVPFRDIGQQEVKNLPRRVHAFTVDWKGLAGSARPVTERASGRLALALGATVGAVLLLALGVGVGAGLLQSGRVAPPDTPTDRAARLPAPAPQPAPAPTEAPPVVQGTALPDPAPTVAANAPLPLTPPVPPPTASFLRSNNGWIVTLQLPEVAHRIGWRIGEGEFRDTPRLSVTDPHTGQPRPSPSFELPARTPASTIEVDYDTPEGLRRGPFPIAFDPQVALVSAHKAVLEQSQLSWVAFRRGRPELVYVTHLVVLRCAIRRASYGVDDGPLNQTIPLPPCDPAQPFAVPEDMAPFLRFPVPPRKLRVQLDYADGTRSSVVTIERD